MGLLIGGIVNAQALELYARARCLALDIGNTPKLESPEKVMAALTGNGLWVL